MELYWYFALVLITSALTLRKYIMGGAFFVFYFIVALTTSYVVRVSGFDWDINVYAKSMHTETISFYYLKEPVVWFSLRYLYAIIGNEIAVFLFLDFIAFVCIYFTFKSLRLPHYMYVYVFLFFPVFLGYQNILRQFFSEVFFALALVLINFKTVRSGFFFLISFLSHNVGAYFLPVLINRYFTDGLKKTTFTVLSILLMALLLYNAKDKNSAGSTSGMELQYVYIFLIFIIYMFLLFIPRNNGVKTYLSTVGVFLVLNFVAVGFLSSTQSERISMFSLFIVFIYLSLAVDVSFKQKVLARNIFIVFGVSPLFVFPATLSFLL